MYTYIYIYIYVYLIVYPIMIGDIPIKSYSISLIAISPIDVPPP